MLLWTLILSDQVIPSPRWQTYLRRGNQEFHFVHTLIFLWIQSRRTLRKNRRIRISRSKQNLFCNKDVWIVCMMCVMQRGDPLPACFQLSCIEYWGIKQTNPNQVASHYSHSLLNWVPLSPSLSIFSPYSSPFLDYPPATHQLLWKHPYILGHYLSHDPRTCPTASICTRTKLLYSSKISPSDHTPANQTHSNFQLSFQLLSVFLTLFKGTWFQLSRGISSI